MDKLLILLRSNKLLVIQSVIIMLLALDLIVVGAITENVTNSAKELARKLRNLKINETEQTLKKLDSVIDYYKPPVMQSDEARAWLLESLESFRLLYGAKITKQITETDSSFTAGVEFKFLPENPQDIIQLLEYMKNSISPIYSITNMYFAKEPGGRSVTIRADMIQPFIGGKYVF